MSITFTRGGSSVTLRSPLFPYLPERIKRKVVTETAGGTIVVQTKAAEVLEWTLRFRNLTTTERDNLHTFWQSTIDGPDETFTYTDPAAANHANCRCMDTTFGFEMTSEGRWAGTWRMRMEI